MIRRAILGTAGAAATLAMLAGCTLFGPTPSPASPSPSPRPSAVHRGLLSVLLGNPGNPLVAEEGLIAQAEARKRGYTTAVSHHGGDVAVEKKLIDEAIASRPVAIILDPASASGSLRSAKKAVAAGIPLFVIDTPLSQEGVAVAQLSSDNQKCATLGAESWVEAMGGKGAFVELLGAASDSDSAGRAYSFDTVTAKSPGLTLLARETVDGNEQRRHDKIRALIAAFPNVAGILAANDQLALAAIAGLKEAGKTGSVKVGGFDGSPDAASAVKAGTLQYTVLQPVVTFTTKAVDEADRFLRTGSTGAPVEKQSFDCTLITKTNVSRYSSFALTE